MNKIRLGYACISVPLKNIGVFTSRGLTLKTLKDKGMDYVIDLCTKNVIDLISMIEYNHMIGINFFRMSSDMFPHINNPKSKEMNYEIKSVKKFLVKAGKLANEYGQRLTMHIGQYAQLATENDKILQQTIADLQTHSDIMNVMNLDLNSVNVIHCGGTFGDKEKAIKRFIDNYKKLPKDIYERLVIENDEISYDADDVLKICQELKRPMVFDVHHHAINPCKTPINQLIPQILKTWTDLGLRPKFHISEQKKGKRIGAHSNYVKKIPDFLLEIPKKYNVDIDLMIEAKMKDLAIAKLHNKYFNVRIVGGIPQYVIKKKYQ